jgi:hypothetical protein
MASFFYDGITNDAESEALVEPASCRTLFPPDNPGNSDVDVNCTPTFGTIGSPVRQKSHLQILEDGNPVLETCSRSEGNGEPTVIQCSPVETFHDNACSVASLDSQHVDPRVGASFPSIEREPDRTPTQPRLRLSPPSHAPGTAKSASAPKLKDLWQRTLASQTQSGLKRASNNTWEYKHDEIDQEVLAQLPAEIQLELRHSLKLPRPTKRPSISDFFPSSK